jgi:hypothetical protein
VVDALERLPSNRMRQYVRAWINEWDLRHLDPSYQPHSSVLDGHLDYSEDATLEGNEDPGR